MANMLYEGKAKKVFETENPNEVIIYYKDDATAMNGLKKGTIVDKGIMNNTITSFFFDLLGKNGIPHHQIKKLSDREALCKKVTIIPIEVVTRNIAAGSLAQKMGVEEGYVMKRPIVEFYYKNDDLGDPMINADYAEAFGLATDAQVAEIKAYALKINEILKAFLTERKVRLIDFKLELASMPTVKSSSPMRSPLIPAACGTGTPTKSSTKTASAAIWAASKKPIRKSSNA